MDIENRVNIKKQSYFIKLYKKLITNDKVIINKKKINEGVAGKIYLITFTQDNKLLFKLTMKKQLNDERNKYEKYANIQTSTIIKNNILPNFILHYNSYCEPTNCYYFMEHLSYDFEHFLIAPRVEIEILSFYFQILSAIYVLNKYLSICHRDITHSNIMYSKIKNTNKSYIEYNVNKVSYYIPTFNKLFVLIDYGRIRSLKLLRTYTTESCVQKNTDMILFSKILFNMYLLEIVGKNKMKKFGKQHIYNNIRKKYPEKSEHYIIDNKRKFLYILYKKIKIKKLIFIF
jgi:serine/threonine protein kinase